MTKVYNAEVGKLLCYSTSNNNYVWNFGSFDLSSQTANWKIFLDDMGCYIFVIESKLDGSVFYCNQNGTPIAWIAESVLKLMEKL